VAYNNFCVRLWHLARSEISHVARCLTRARDAQSLISDANSESPDDDYSQEISAQFYSTGPIWHPAIGHRCSRNCVANRDIVQASRGKRLATSSAEIISTVDDPALLTAQRSPSDARAHRRLSLPHLVTGTRWKLWKRAGVICATQPAIGTIPSAYFVLADPVDSTCDRNSFLSAWTSAICAVCS